MDFDEYGMSENVKNCKNLVESTTSEYLVDT